jgi:hypothetical protein
MFGDWFIHDFTEIFLCVANLGDFFDMSVYPSSSLEVRKMLDWERRGGVLFILNVPQQ